MFFIASVTVVHNVHLQVRFDHVDQEEVLSDKHLDTFLEFETHADQND